MLLAAGVKPDFEFSGGDAETDLDYIHRRDGETDIYFVANRRNRTESVTCTFRVAGKAPELWDPVSGSRRFAAAYTEADGRTSLPLEFAPCGSWFVVFREPSAKHPATAQSNITQQTTLSELSGPWQVTFDPQWGGPGTVEFPDLVSWPERDEPGIKFYSGTAVYRKTFELPDACQFPFETNASGSISATFVNSPKSTSTANPAASPGRRRFAWTSATRSSPARTNWKSKSSTSGPTGSSAMTRCRRTSD